MEKLVCEDGNEYRIYRDSILGKGGFAIVFKGKNVKDKKEVAIKEIHKNFDYGHQEIKQMAELSKDSRNNYVVPLLDHYVHEEKNIKRLYLVLPYYKHGSLSSYISQNGSLSPKIAAPVFLQIVNGLEYLHKNKEIMHRDLTPGNILIENVSDNKIRRVLISDLGLAKKYEKNSKKLQTQCGTPGYMPPEFCLGIYNMASEVYSLGGILYFMLTQKHPDTGKEDQQIKNVKDEQAADLIKNVWYHKPSRRLSVRAIKSHAFFTGVSLSQSNTGNSEKKPSRRRSSPGCSHRLKDKNNYCSGCQKFVGSRDSAYASADQKSKKTNEESRRRTSSRPPSTKEQQTNDENAHGESRRRTSSRPPSINERQTNDENAIEWPIISLNSIFPQGKPFKETRLIDDKKGRYMITQWNVLVFEALDGDRKYVRYIFEIIVNDSKQKFLIYEPNSHREQLRKLEDDPIRGEKLIDTIKHAKNLTADYMYYYKLMIKAVKKLHKRNALLHYGYLYGIRDYAAKLMCDRSFRYIKNGETFLEQDDGSLKSDTGKSKLSEEEIKMFFDYKKLLQIDDRGRVEIFGKWYRPAHLDEKIAG